jgi:hypothetical protein
MSYPEVPNAQSDKPLITNTDSYTSSQNIYNQQPIMPQTTQPIVQTGINDQVNNLPSPVGPYVQPPVSVAQPTVVQPTVVQPTVAVVQPIIPVNNQVLPNQPIFRNPFEFKTLPVLCTCPNCKNNVTTIVQTNFNWPNCCCCFWTGLIWWIIFQLIRNKELNCDDAVHICPVCNFQIGNYTAC